MAAALYYEGPMPVIHLTLAPNSQVLNKGHLNQRPYLFLFVCLLVCFQLITFLLPHIFFSDTDLAVLTLS